MEINNISITDNILTIDVDSTVGITSVLIDNLYNTTNMYSEDITLHTYNVTNFETTSTKISIDILQYIPNLDISAFTVNINGVVKFYYDAKELYYKQIDLVTENCSTCLNNYKMSIFQALLLKLYMFDYAIANNILQDQISIYTDIARILSIDLTTNVQNIGDCSFNNYTLC